MLKVILLIQELLSNVLIQRIKIYFFLFCGLKSKKNNIEICRLPSSPPYVSEDRTLFYEKIAICAQKACAARVRRKCPPEHEGCSVFGRDLHALEGCQLPRCILKGCSFPLKKFCEKHGVLLYKLLRDTKRCNIHIANLLNIDDNFETS